MVECIIAMGDQNMQVASWSLLKEYTVVDRYFLIVMVSLCLSGYQITLAWIEYMSRLVYVIG